MAIKAYNPTSPARRGMTSQNFDDVTSKRPVRSLLMPKRRGNGRNNQGRITTRHQGGGAHNFYRIVNFRLPSGVTAVIEHIEYDPNRSARIARINRKTFHNGCPEADGVKCPAHEPGDAPARAPGGRQRL